MQDEALSPAQSLRNSRLVVSARLVSDFGAFLNMVALSTYVYVISGSAVGVGVFLACRVFGGMLASLIGTPLYRRVRGRWPLVAFDVLRAGLLGLLLILPTAVQWPVLPLIAFGIGLSNSLFAIGLNSQLPTLVRAEHLVSTNAWLTSVASTGAVAGSLVSGLMVAAWGFEAVFALNVLTYLLAALCIAPIYCPPVAAAAGKAKVALSSEWDALRAGLKASPVVAAMLFVTLGDTLGSAAHNVGFPILSQLVSPLEAGKVMGLMLACWAIGKFVGAQLARRWATGLAEAQRDSGLERLFMLGVCLMSLGFIVTFRQASLLYLMLLIIPAGIGDGLAEVGLISRVQRAPDSLRLPIFSLLTLMQMTGFGLGMLIAAPFFGWMAPANVILLFHGIPLLMLASMSPRFKKLVPQAG